jgi:hypothetical protein
VTSLIWISLALIVAGLLMCWLSSAVKYPIIVSVVLWTGIVLVVVGLVLLLTPVIVWINWQLRSILGT